MNDLFLHDSLDTSPVVFSDRILYTPTSFAKTALASCLKGCLCLTAPISSCLN